jgi:hypothetical protein
VVRLRGLEPPRELPHSDLKLTILSQQNQILKYIP